MTDPAAGGPALKTAIHVARARSGITSDMALSIAAGVHYDTLMNWYSGRTVPRPAELAKVAKALDVSLNDLMAAYEGRPLEPPPLQDAIADLIDELRLSRAQQHESTLAILQALGAMARRDRDPEGTPGDTHDAARSDSPASGTPGRSDRTTRDP